MTVRYDTAITKAETYIPLCLFGPGSSVSILTKLRLGDWVPFPEGTKIISAIAFRPVLRSPTHRVPEALSPRYIKRPKHEPDYSPQFTAELRMRVAVPPHLNAFMERR